MIGNDKLINAILDLALQVKSLHKFSMQALLKRFQTMKSA